ncbi:MAG: peptidylprolyl isomerase [Vicinamibacterales bacterium]
MDLLIDLATSSWPSMRAASLTAIAHIDPDTFLTVLSSLDADAHWSVRAAVAAALGGLGPERGSARLHAMLDAEDARVDPAVLTAMAAAGLEDAAQVLTARSHHGRCGRPDGGRQRPRAPEGHGQCARDRRRAPAASGDASAWTCGHAVGARDADPSLARPALTAALGDSDWAVRVRAAELLTQLDPASPASPETPAPELALTGDALKTLISPPFTPTAYIDTTAGMIEVELAIVDAPRTVANFTDLARRGFFVNVPFHRVVPDFVVQGGDPRGDGEGGPGYTIRDEINQRPYMRGTMGMALDWRDTGGSQFFITHSPQPHLDGRYTVFGQVVSGMDVVDRLKQWT